MKSIVYFLANGKEIKIGFTVDFNIRLVNLRRENGPLEVLGTIPGDRKKERAMHNKFAAYRLHGEWFSDTAYLRDEIAKILAAPHAPPKERDYDVIGRALRKVFPTGNAAEQLRDAIGVEIRLAYRYVHEQRTVPNKVFRNLLRNGEHGENFLRAVMEGCDQPWWLQLERELDANAAARAAKAANQTESNEGSIA